MPLDPTRIEVTDPRMVEVWRKKTPAESLKMGLRMWNYARDRLLLSVRWQHPDWDEEQVKREVSRRLLDGSRTAVVPPRRNP